MPKRLNEWADQSDPGELSPSDAFEAKSSFGWSVVALAACEGVGDGAGDGSVRFEPIEVG